MRRRLGVWLSSVRHYAEQKINATTLTNEHIYPGQLKHSLEALVTAPILVAVMELHFNANSADICSTFKGDSNHFIFAF